jgi:hypothetical protein
VADFALHKWYLDITDGFGRVFIGYCVHLKWGQAAIRGYQSLWRFPDGQVTSDTKIGRAPEPSSDMAGCLLWRPTGIEAVWQPAAKSIEEKLLETADGEIVWRCSQPKARASITSSAINLSGWGYAECIDITIPVWKLPFRTLYWGRCHTDNHYLVWIKWEGRTERSLIWFDGNCSQDLVITGNRVAGSQFELELGERMALRKGKIGSTIARPLGGKLEFLPKTVLSLNERKWYCRGVLCASGSRAETGTVIYEKVSW